MASSEGVTCSRCGGSSLSSWDLFLPISRRGRFFQDSFFSSIHHDFDAAVREVLGRWSEPGLELTDSYDDVSQRYRQLRSRNLKEDNQAVTVTSDSQTHKIVLDVHEFMGGDVKVKVVNEMELIVEGRVEKREEGSSTVSTHSFRRFFSLPENTDMAAITPVMSADGILTITAPKLERKATVIPVAGEEKASVSSSTITDETSVQGNATSERECQCPRCSLKNIYEQRAQKEEASRSSTAAAQSVESQIIQDSTKSKQTLETSPPSSTQKIDIQTAATSHRDRQSSDQFQSEFRQGTNRIRRDSWDELLPITTRGSFFQDSFFSDIHQDFDEAVRKVLERWDKTERQEENELRRSDTLNRYRRLRSRDLTEESLAITVTSDTSCHKITLDVHDFVGGDLKVKIVSANELVVEGCLEKKEEGGAVATFKQSFNLPDICNIKEITAVMSSDGILTITAPKGIQDQQSKDTPVDLQRQRDIESQIVTSFSAPEISRSSVSTTSRSAAEEASLGIQRDNQEIVGEKTSFRSREGTKIPINVEGSVDATTQASKIDGESAISLEQSSVARIRGLSLPVRMRGLFLDDSCFQDVRMDYQNAIKDVLRKRGEDFSDTESFSSYRNLRSRDLRDETQAVVSSESECQHKFVLDVRDFMEGGEVNVRAVSEREIVVEGHLEKKEGGSTSIKQFMRHFVVPGDIQMDTVSSEISSDGVLVILAPKKTEAQSSSVQNISLSSASTSKSIAQSSSMNVQSSNQTVAEEGVSVRSREGTKIPINVEETLETTIQQASSQPSNIISSESVAQSDASVSSRKQLSTKTSEYTLTSGLSLPVRKRGLFFDDSCFQEVRTSYQNAIKDVLRKLGMEFSDTEAFNSYRSLRSRDLRDETQAVVSSENEHHHKFVLDVRDFMEGGEVNVKSVSEREIVVEGHLEKKEGGSTSIKRFVRRFVVPGDIQVDAVNSEMSSDGVLVILAPKKTETQSTTSKSIVQGSSMNVITSSQTVAEEGVSVRSGEGTKIPINVEETLETTIQQASSRPSDIISSESLADSEASVSSRSQLSTKTSEHRFTSGLSLPIGKRGLFFDDSCFQEVRTSYQNAVKDVLRKLGTEFSDTETIDSYRSLRSRDLRDETQAVVSSESEHHHKFVLDVRDFMEGGEVNVKAVSERELVVEGHLEKKEGGSTSIKQFVRRFVVPSNIEMDAVNSEMSSDGVLFIVAPKKTETQSTSVQTASHPSQIMSSESVRESDASISRISQLSAPKKSDLAFGTSLPIRKRGLFLDDSCFQDVRADYQNAIKGVLMKWGENFSGSETYDSYRILRSRDLRDETQAVVSSESEGFHKFVLDVRDFMDGGEVNVRTVSEKELVVEGHLEKKEGGSTSMKRFVRRFIVPGDIEMDAVNSEMSSDGVLLILVPKTQKSKSTPVEDKSTSSQSVSLSSVSASQSIDESKRRVKEGFCLPILKRGLFTEDSCFQDARLDYQRAIKEVLAKCGEQFSDTDAFECYRSLRRRDLRDETQAVFSSESELYHKFILDARDFIEGGEVSVRAVGKRELVVEGHLEKTEGGSTSIKRFVRHFAVPNDIQMDTVSSEMSSDGVLFIRAQKSATQQSSESQSMEAVVVGLNLPIIKRGLFFDDPCFKDARKEYQKEIRSILTKCGEEFSGFDDVDCYRRLRSRDLRDETQAVFSAEGERHYKFILDVHDFMEGGEVSVKAVSDRELAVEGTLEVKEGGSSSTKRFVRRFVLAGDIQIDAVSSVMSSDGVLLIFAPKTRLNVTDSAYSTTAIKRQEDQESKLGDENSFIAVVRQPDYHYNLQTDASETGQANFMSSSMTGSSYLPIVRKGGFSDDFYFENFRENYSQAVREVLEKAREWSCPSEALQNYRSLRKRNLKLENQAVNVSEDERSQRVVMDVQDFLGGDLTAQLIGENELIVEGKAERKEDNRISRLSFVRRFTLPKGVARKSICAALSSDGILTITSEKRGSS